MALQEIDILYVNSRAIGRPESGLSAISGAFWLRSDSTTKIPGVFSIRIVTNCLLKIHQIWSLPRF